MYAMHYRELANTLEAHGCTSRATTTIRADLEVWHCPCGQHLTVLAPPDRVSPGLVREAILRLECLPDNWLETR